MHAIFRSALTFFISLLAVGVIAACATSQAPLPALEHARSSVARTSAEPAVARYAQKEMQEATDTLARAEHVWAYEKDTPATNHLADLALQRAALARHTAQARQMNAPIP